MNVSDILSELRAERDRLDKAIEALDGTGRTGRTTSRGPRKGRMSEAARKRLSRLLKQRWASGKMGRRKAKAA